MLPILAPVLISLVEKFGPKLVQSITGSERAGEIAQTVTDAALEITGAQTLDEADVLLKANPELALGFQERMARIEADEYAAQLADVKDARARDIAITKDGGVNYRSWILLGIDIVFVILPVLIASLVVFGGLTVDQAIWTALFSMLSGMFGWGLKSLSSIHDFEFGSTKSSRQKDDVIASAITLPKL